MHVIENKQMDMFIKQKKTPDFFFIKKKKKAHHIFLIQCMIICK